MPRYVYFCNSALVMFSTFIPYLLQSIWNLFQTYPRGQNFDNSIRRFDVSCGCTYTQMHLFYIITMSGKIELQLIAFEPGVTNSEKLCNCHVFSKL